MILLPTNREQNPLCLLGSTSRTHLLLHSLGALNLKETRPTGVNDEVECGQFGCCTSIWGGQSEGVGEKAFVARLYVV